MDRALRKTADECIRERTREYQMRFLRRLFLPERECCFRNRTSLLPSFAARAWRRREPPSIPSRARCMRPDFSGAMRARPQATFRAARIRLTRRVRWFDPSQRQE